MDLEKQLKICSAAPSVFYRTPMGETTEIPFPFECGNGWADLLYDAAVKLNAYLETMPKEVREDIVAMQVKEKYGTLRFYISYYNDEIDAIIREAEKKSCTTCETCGKKGKTRGKFWLYTACDEHTREEDLQDVPEKELP